MAADMAVAAELLQLSNAASPFGSLAGKKTQEKEHFLRFLTYFLFLFLFLCHANLPM